MLVRAIFLSLLVHLLLLGATSDFLYSGGGAKQIAGEQQLAALLNNKKSMPALVQRSALPESTGQRTVGQKSARGLFGQSPAAKPNSEAQKLVDSNLRKLGEEGANKEDLLRYRINLAREARKQAFLPALARKQEWEGELVLNIDLGKVRMPQVDLKQGSGQQGFDEEILARFRYVVAAVNPPRELADQSSVVPVVLNFSRAD